MDPKETTGVNELAPGAADPGQEAINTEEQQPSETGKTEVQETTVPLEALQSVRTEMQAAKDQNVSLQQQIALYQARLEGQTAKQPEPGVAVADVGADDDIVTVGQLRQILQQNQGTGELQAIKQKLDLLGQSVQNPEMIQDVKTKLPGIIQNNPALAQMIQTAPNPLQAAYELTKLSATPAQPKTDIMSSLNKIIQNAQKPKSTATAGTGGNQLELDIANMSDEDFRAHVAKVKAGG